MATARQPAPHRGAARVRVGDRAQPRRGPARPRRARRGDAALAPCGGDHLRHRHRALPRRRYE
ncbi:MAG: hypothetical protein DLM65_00765 [Candidatus Aeolococcus gillhamiae]|uniref:Uncharacterized protein n=1 Tax=Candidatus Aeolococcus gillhamiae TaxID=3127015 RepID=A0A2W5ZJE5_9BACT|nr:MAG: hypothetical protein DLM65_00765 [Candidatus Dormibacter sp. RRmetagenome_bin12]